MDVVCFGGFLAVRTAATSIRERKKWCCASWGSGERSWGREMAGEDEQGSGGAQERPSTRLGLQARGWAELAWGRCALGCAGWGTRGWAWGAGLRTVGWGNGLLGRCGGDGAGQLGRRREQAAGREACWADGKGGGALGHEGGRGVGRTKGKWDGPGRGGKVFFYLFPIFFFIRSLFQLNLYVRMIHESNGCTLKATRPTKITLLQHDATTIILLRFC
jgi:hypothetical protein